MGLLIIQKIRLNARENKIHKKYDQISYAENKKSIIKYHYEKVVKELENVI